MFCGNDRNLPHCPPNCNRFVFLTIIQDIQIFQFCILSMRKMWPCWVPALTCIFFLILSVFQNDLALHSDVLVRDHSSVFQRGFHHHCHTAQVQHPMHLLRSFLWEWPSCQALFLCQFFPYLSYLVAENNVCTQDIRNAYTCHFKQKRSPGYLLFLISFTCSVLFFFGYHG